MAQYLYVDNYASGGQLGISAFTFNQLAGQAIHRVILNHSDAKLTLEKPINARIHNNQLTINLVLNMSKDSDIANITSELQEHVARLVTTMTDIVPYAINIKVASLF